MGILLSWLQLIPAFLGCEFSIFMNFMCLCYQVVIHTMLLFILRIKLKNKVKFFSHFPSLFFSLHNSLPKSMIQTRPWGYFVSACWSFCFSLPPPIKIWKALCLLLETYVYHYCIACLDELFFSLRSLMNYFLVLAIYSKYRS